MNCNTFLTGILLFLIPLAGFTQDVINTSDSLVIYKFTGPQDSIPHMKTETVNKDSLFRSQIYTEFYWDLGELDWKYSFRSIRILNSNGLILRSEDLEWVRETGEWLKNKLMEYTYDEAGRQTDMTQYEWNKKDLEWRKSTTKEFRFDSNGQLVFEQETYDLQFTGIEKTYVYHSDGMLDSILMHSWFEEDHGYRYALFTYERTDTGRTSVREHFNYGETNPLDRLENSYDELGNHIEEIFSYKVGGVLTPRSKKVFEYDQRGYQNQVLKYRYEASQNRWVEETLTTDSLDSEGLSLKRAVYDWDESDGKWTGDYRIDHDYDAQDRTIVVNQFHWDNETDNWYLYHYALLDYLRKDCKQMSEIFDLDDEASSFKLVQRNWEFDGGFIGSTYDSICEGDEFSWQDEVYSEEGRYEKFFTSDFGADSIHILMLSINPAPPPVLVSGETEVIGGMDYLYMASGNSGNSIMWSVDQGELIQNAGEDSARVLWSGTGLGSVWAWTVSNLGCVSASSILEVNISYTGLGKSGTLPLVIYPIPVKDVVHLRNAPEGVILEIVDLNGRTLYRSQGQEHSLANLQSGIYTAILWKSNGMVLLTQKVLVQSD